MIRINLIPPEITQKRRSESRLLLMVGVFLVAMVLMGAFAAVMFAQVGFKEDEVAAATQELESVKLQAERFRVFEDTEKELELRAQIAEETMQGAIDWSRLCEEVSLVLPDDVWLSAINANEVDGMTLVGRALDYLDDAPDVGHKAIARTLVRLTDLEQLYNVWLTSSVKAGPQEEFEESWLDFQITASVQEPEPVDSAEGDPAPPADSP